MSRTTLMAIHVDGAIADVMEYRNSHGFAAKIWGDICAKYFGDRVFWLCNPTGSENLWRLWKDERLPIHWRVALNSTFDRALISKATFKEVADCLRRFSAETLNDGYVDHLPAIAGDLESLASDESVVAACFHATSVSENTWRVYDSDTDSVKNYDLNTEANHFFVWESVMEQEAKAAK